MSILTFIVSLTSGGVMLWHKMDVQASEAKEHIHQLQQQTTSISDIIKQHSEEIRELHAADVHILEIISKR
jgi:uncharacterized protein YoaH (UPF0181 family)